MNRQQRRAQGGPKGGTRGRAAVEDDFAKAVHRHRAGEREAARALYEAVLAVRPRHADALHLLGVLALDGGRSEAAVGLFGKAIAAAPGNALYRANLGTALITLGRHAPAIASFEAAIALRPDHAAAHAGLADAHAGLGTTLKAQGRFEDAIAAYRTSLGIRPDHAETLYNLGNASSAMGRREDAVAAYRGSVAQDPGLLQGWYNLGNALSDLGQITEAIASYRAAIGRAPDDVAPYCNLGNALLEAGEVEAAVLAYETAIRLQPDRSAAWSNLVASLQYRDGNAGRIADAVGGYAQRFETGEIPMSFWNRRDPDRRLRIGYVSGDFGLHPVGHHLAPVLAAHDPDVVETFCYATRDRDDAMTGRLRTDADHWRSVASLSDRDAAGLIRSDAIDILVDLSGHTAHNRLTLFAAKSAPIQATWLGYWGTTGLSRMDAILSDGVTIGDGEEFGYAERVMRLPFSRFCYQPPDHAPAVVEPPSLRNGHVTFGSFNNLAKIGPEVVRVWSRLLRSAPESRLVLKWRSFGDAAVRGRMLQEFLAHGVAEERIDLRGASPHAEMLAAYGEIDIALDPWPFSGGLTSFEALWMGVPIVTLPGQAPASRQTASCLRVLGLEDWIAGSEPDYLRIAGKRQGLAALRGGLRERMAGSPLCDGPGFARALEAAYREIWTKESVLS